MQEALYSELAQQRALTDDILGAAEERFVSDSRVVYFVRTTNTNCMSTLLGIGSPASGSSPFRKSLLLRIRSRRPLR